MISIRTGLFEKDGTGERGRAGMRNKKEEGRHENLDYQAEYS